MAIDIEIDHSCYTLFWMLLLHSLIIGIWHLKIYLGLLSAKASLTQYLEDRVLQILNFDLWLYYIYFFSQQIFIGYHFVIFLTFIIWKALQCFWKTKAPALIYFSRALDWLAKCKFENIVITFLSKYLIAQIFHFCFFLPVV